MDFQITHNNRGVNWQALPVMK